MFSLRQCSVTCGQGVQSRQVRCEQKISPSNIATVDSSFCSDDPPPTERSCKLDDCPDPAAPARPSVIVVDTSTFIQLQEKTKVVLTVGGAATVVVGTTVHVQCPVRGGVDRRSIVWRRDGKPLIAAGRIKVSAVGVLRMRKTRPADAGVYTCAAGKDSADIRLAFQSMDDAWRALEERDEFFASLNADEDEDGGGGGAQDDSIRTEMTPKDHFSMRYLESRYPVESLPLYYIPSDWSQCTRTCGGAGLMMRDITCQVTMETYTLITEDHYCDAKGRQKPIETIDCGFGACPEWETGPWSQVGIRPSSL